MDTLFLRGSIVMLLGGKLQWDPVDEEFVGDAEADAMLAREQSKTYTINA
jgi:hypothetical protein